MIKIEQTADGSNTLYVPELDEHYHSVKGALTESEHIFIRTGLNHSPAVSPRILEIGFGTGLNAFLTLLEADRAQRKVHYTTIERFPVTEDTVRSLKYPEQICPQRAEDFYALHSAAWNTDCQLTDFFTLHKVEAEVWRWLRRDLLRCLRSRKTTRNVEPRVVRPTLCFA